MKKIIKKWLRIIISSVIILSFIVPNYAAISASDGSAFVTKAEFDASMSDFNSRLTTFEAGINSKIDSQVTSYLDRNGIWNASRIAELENVKFDVPKSSWSALSITGTGNKIKAIASKKFVPRKTGLAIGDCVLHHTNKTHPEVRYNRKDSFSYCDCNLCTYWQCDRTSDNETIWTLPDQVMANDYGGTVSGGYCFNFLFWVEYSTFVATFFVDKGNEYEIKYVGETRSRNDFTLDSGYWNLNGGAKLYIYFRNFAIY